MSRGRAWSAVQVHLSPHGASSRHACPPRERRPGSPVSLWSVVQVHLSPHGAPSRSACLPMERRPGPPVSLWSVVQARLSPHGALSRHACLPMRPPTDSGSTAASVPTGRRTVVPTLLTVAPRHLPHRAPHRRRGIMQICMSREAPDRVLHRPDL